jgi:hypothetical protein
MFRLVRPDLRVRGAYKLQCAVLGILRDKLGQATLYLSSGRYESIFSTVPGLTGCGHRAATERWKS